MTKGTDVLIIGAGLAGLTAAYHAIRAGASVRLIATGWGQQIVAPGWISVWDSAQDDVLAAAQQHAAAHADHPYAAAGDLTAALDAFKALTADLDLPYVSRADGRNFRLPTLLGALQTPYLAPSSMAHGDLTDTNGPVLIVGFAGWRDFHPELTAQTLAAQGIKARARRITLPDSDSHWDRWPGDLAHLLEGADVRAALVKQIKPQLGDAVAVGFPAVLGLDQHSTLIADLSARLECRVFELPTLPPSLPGTRLSTQLRRWLLRHHARVQIGHPVVGAISHNRRVHGVTVGALGHTNAFYADQCLLATGDMYNGGLQTDADGHLWEPVFNVPVTSQAGEGRAGWFADHLLAAHGHPLHSAGIRVGANLQPLDASGSPLFDNLYAAGHILAEFNPLTDGCAEGVALATAYRAIQLITEETA